MCEFCPGTDAARCPVCACDVPLTPENAGKRHHPETVLWRGEPMTPREIDQAVTRARAVLAEWRLQVEQLEDELAALLQLAGRRPEDGSDQPALFETDATPSMF